MHYAFDILEDVVKTSYSYEVSFLWNELQWSLHVNSHPSPFSTTPTASVHISCRRYDRQVFSTNFTRERTLERAWVQVA